MGSTAAPEKVHIRSRTCTVKQIRLCLAASKLLLGTNHDAPCAQLRFHADKGRGEWLQAGVTWGYLERKAEAGRPTSPVVTMCSDSSLHTTLLISHDERLEGTQHQAEYL